MRLVAITSASKPSIAINATQRAIAAPQRTNCFNSFDLWRRNRDGNEGSTGRICDEVRRIAANIAKLPEMLRGKN
jgi:hypothetical protein